MGFMTGKRVLIVGLASKLSIAHGIAQAANNRQAQSPKGKAFIVMAELFLMQHSCHWFCRSRLVAHARLLARHQTPYEKVLNSVAPQTRQAYCALVGCAR